MNRYYLKVIVSRQKLLLLEKDIIVKQYLISTSKYGIGNKSGSNKTPLGDHIVCSKIGRGAPMGAIFVKRRDTSKIANIRRLKGVDSSDFITSRIIHLRGLENGVNCGEGVDSYKRYIYIHGTPDEWLIGKPASHGCIRMRNRDIIELFSLIKKGVLVRIQK